MYLPGKQNLEADFLSCGKLPGEWQLHPELVPNIWDLFSKAKVDLFSSQKTIHSPFWFNWTEETNLLGQDAMAHDWHEVFLYAFPPFPLIQAVLQRVLQQVHRLLLVAHFWLGRT